MSLRVVSLLKEPGGASVQGSLGGTSGEDKKNEKDEKEDSGDPPLKEDGESLAAALADPRHFLGPEDDEDDEDEEGEAGAKRERKAKLKRRAVSNKSWEEAKERFKKVSVYPFTGMIRTPFEKRRANIRFVFS